LAASNGYTAIVDILLESGHSDPNSKNNLNLTPIELSCINGHFETAKNLIDHSDINAIKLEINGQHPLHLAAKKGQHELIKQLLDKGAKINVLDKNNMNCLDIAIQCEHREVIKVLLDDIKWFQLIRTNSKDIFEIDEETDDFKVLVNPNYKATTTPSLSPVIKQPVSTLEAMYKKELWDGMKTILDKCQINDDEFNFSIIDAPIKSVNKHSLSLIARSGQESLIKHRVTTQLLKLKWSFIPRFAFYLNLFLYFLYLFLFTWYIMELSMLNENDLDEETFNINNNNNTSSNYTKNLFINAKSENSLVLFKANRARKVPTDENKVKQQPQIEKANRSVDFLTVSCKN
jgi:hypothetical protein